MATAIAAVVGTALVNALAFSGSNYLFSHLDKDNYKKEMSRHNLAMEQLNREEEERKKRLDFLNNRLRKEMSTQMYSQKDFINTDKYMTLYAEIYNLKKRRSNIEDFYKPSEELKKYEVLYYILAGGGLLVGIYWINTKRNKK